MRSSRYIITIILMLATLGGFSQSNGNFWQLGVGYNFVDDSGPGLNDYFNFDEIWHALPYPSRLTVGYYMDNGFGFEAIGSYNEYDAGKIIDGAVLPEDQTYVALDGKISYDLNKIFGQTGWFDPYLMTGAGYTWIGAVDRATFNAGGGFNIWFSNTIGLNLNSMGKWGLFTDRGTNHVQHSVGLIFKLGQQRSPNTLEDSGSLPVETEQGMVEETPDNEIRSEENAPEMNPQPEEVVVAAVPAVPEKSEEELRKEEIEKALEALPKVYYAYNSSYLTQEDKAIVDQLVRFMEIYPEVSIEVQAHADARGSDKYNTWLSERRAKRIIDYVIAHGIPADRISGIGLGENKILNHCTNDVTCSEEEHRENRRAAYSIE